MLKRAHSRRGKINPAGKTVTVQLGLVAFGRGLLIKHYSEAAQQSQTPKSATAQKEPATSKADQPAPQKGKGTVTGSLSRSSAPVQALVSLGKGQLVVRTPSFSSVSPLTKVVDGKNVTSYFVKDKVTTTSYDLKDVKISDMTGKRIDVKELSKLLNKEIVALIAKDGIEVDPLHLRLFKEETLLFLLPLPDPAPVIGISLDAPPSLPMPGVEPTPPPAPQPTPPPSLNDSFLGNWQVVDIAYEGKSVPREKLDKAQAVIGSRRISIQFPKAKEGNFELIYKLVPEGMDLLRPNEPWTNPLLGVFDVKDDTLRIAFDNGSGKGRLRAPEPDKDSTYIVLKKVKN